MREPDLELYAKPYLDRNYYSGTDLKERVHVAGGTLVLESHVTSAVPGLDVWGDSVILNRYGIIWICIKYCGDPHSHLLIRRPARKTRVASATEFSRSE